MTNIPLYRWNSKFFGTSGSWTPVEESDVRISKKFKVLDPKLSGSEALSLKIATWNVWFDATLQKLRTNELLKVLIAEVAVAFQTDAPFLNSIIRMLLES